MLDGGASTCGFNPREHELYDHAGVDASFYVPTCIAGDEVFLATSKMGTDTQKNYRNRVSVPIFLGIGISFIDVLPHLDQKLYGRNTFHFTKSCIPDLATGNVIHI